MTIYSPSNTAGFEINPAGPGAPDGVSLAICHFDDDPTKITVRRDDFLEEVRALGVLAIDKADLPKVDVDAATGMLHAETARGWESKRSDVNTENLRKRAYALLAIAEYADAHPPVDEAQVGALADLLRTALGVTPETVAAGTLQLGSSDDIARALIATGRVEVQA